LFKEFYKNVGHFNIILIKNFPCADRTELDIEEERYKQLLNAQLNTRRAHQTAEQRKEQLTVNSNERKICKNNSSKI
jgi:hypothetical protein